MIRGGSSRAAIAATLLLSALGGGAAAVPTRVRQPNPGDVRVPTKQGRVKWRRGAQAWYVLRDFAADRYHGVRDFDAWLIKTGRTGRAHIANKRLRRANRGRRA